MGKSSRKPRQKLDPKKYVEGESGPSKKDKDWSFDDVLRSKPRRR